MSPAVDGNFLLSTYFERVASNLPCMYKQERRNSNNRTFVWVAPWPCRFTFSPSGIDVCGLHTNRHIRYSYPGTRAAPLVFVHVCTLTEPHGLRCVDCMANSMFITTEPPRLPIFCGPALLRAARCTLCAAIVVG